MDQLEKAIIVALDSARDKTIDGTLMLIRTVQNPDGSISATMAQKLVASLESMKKPTPTPSEAVPV
jgi:hypothetical protein